MCCYVVSSVLGCYCFVVVGECCGCWMWIGYCVCWFVMLVICCVFFCRYRCSCCVVDVVCSVCYWLVMWFFVYWFWMVLLGLVWVGGFFDWCVLLCSVLVGWESWKWCSLGSRWGCLLGWLCGCFDGGVMFVLVCYDIGYVLFLDVG